MKKNSIIDDFLKNNQELLKYTRGVPFVGNRINKMDYTDSVFEIVNGYSFYTEKLFNTVKRDGAIENGSLDSGNPMKFKPFRPIITEFKKKNYRYSFYRYPSASGDESCRKKVAEYMNKNDFYLLNNKLDQSNIIFTISTTHALNIIIQSIANINDIIITTAPNYGLFTIICERLGLNVKYLYLEKVDNYQINPKKLEMLVDSINSDINKKYKDSTDKPKIAAFLNLNPNNPTGKVLGDKNKKVLIDIGNIAVKNNFFIIDDLVYKDITYDRSNLAMPIGNYSNCFDNCITLYGLSKSFGCAGLRCGIVVANRYIIKKIKNYIFQEMDSIPLLTSYYCAGAYNNSFYRNIYYKCYFNKIIKKYKDNYRLLKYLIDGNIANRKYLKYINRYGDKYYKNWSGIKEIKFVDSLDVDSGFFAIINLSDIIEAIGLNKEITEEELYMFIYKNTGLKYIMGKSFAWPNRNEFVARINFGEPREILVKCFIKLYELIEEEKKNGKTSVLNNK